MSRVPDIPGELVPPQSPEHHYLRSLVSKLCHLDHDRFPGAQPVSFGTRDLLKLESQDFWVCEKSDGIRVLFLVHVDMQSPDNQRVYLIDRHNKYRMLDGFFFPHHENPMHPLRDTLLDGELLIDVDPHTNKETLRLLVFDCLVVDGQNVMSRPLDKRYGRLNEWFYKPYAKMLRDYPEMIESALFQIKVKPIRSSYNADQVFTVDIPALQHGNDGLIYTCVNAPYTPGTDSNIMKWKPPSENSIDFKLVLRFPPLPNNPKEPDFCAKPVFLLEAWCGDKNGVAKYEQYDHLYVEDKEWEEYRMKRSGEQYDDRIVEVHWDPDAMHWRMMRFRNDKPNGNHINVVENIIQSIAEGVDKDLLLSRSNRIRAAWKTRQGQPQAPPSASVQPRISQPMPQAEYRYGGIASSPWSKVAGPEVVYGFHR
ncbi:mRNA capping enzyme, alpha subunit [Dendrothele bispora CBS 962.96]|uniref:mRNA-capping enzyme subunit alpha n=1 Tax=Dendrothele bispora (strain CBS 962.96) TaxID=1314807 RepID=A0A4S8LAL6_DENBC|nr:mRNA capping enzyme, alpha subunit [Dendrothele bispora CBS 962.96]